jgi:hypothetical protein
LGKRTNQINVEMCEPASWNRNVGSLEVDMTIDFSFLTRQARPGPNCYISSHVGPAETATNQATGGADTWVIDAVKVGKNLFSKGGGNERTKNTGGNVPKKISSLNNSRNNTQAWQQLHGGYIRTPPLGGGNVRKIDRLRIGDGGLRDN